MVHYKRGLGHEKIRFLQLRALACTAVERLFSRKSSQNFAKPFKVGAYVRRAKAVTRLDGLPFNERLLQAVSRFSDMLHTGRLLMRSTMTSS